MSQPDPTHASEDETKPETWLGTCDQCLSDCPSWEKFCCDDCEKRFNGELNEEADDDGR